MIRKYLIFSLLLIGGWACSKDKDDFVVADCTTNTSKSFATNVNPIIQSTCNNPGCHNAGSTNGPGPLTNYSQISSSASAIRAAIVSGSMPKNSSLNAAQKSSIICWVDAGALNN